MFDETKARKIAEDFISKMNPTHWNGRGRRPKSFDTRIYTYDIDSVNGNELDISFEYLGKDETDKPGWTHYCELRDTFSGDVIIPQHGDGINSVQNLAATIMDVCAAEN